ncbi:MAG TPA: hypothetical protein VFZ47_00630 [Chitinophagaceae bacterium]
MKKALTAIVLVAFAGAVAFASFETNSKKDQKVKQKQEQKDTKKKKECKRTCLFG